MENSELSWGSDILNHKCNNVAFVIFFHNFVFMTKKVKILSAFLTLYLGILPVFFYTHASAHKDHHLNSSCHSQHLVIQDDEGSSCELCNLFFNQALYHSNLSLSGEFTSYITMEKESYFVLSLIIQPLPFLRAPPYLFI